MYRIEVCADSSSAFVGSSGWPLNVPCGGGSVFLPVEDLQHAVVADAPGEVQPVADHVVRRGAAREHAQAVGVVCVEIGPCNDGVEGPVALGCEPTRPCVRR